MKKLTFYSLLLGGALTLAAPSVFASDVPPANAIPAATILQNLQANGYTTVRKIEFDNGEYKVDALDANRKGVDLKIDPKTGNISKTRNSSGREVEAVGNATLSALDIASKVQAAGYHNIYKIEAKEGKYEVKAVDAKNKEAALLVDGKTGDITKKTGLF